MGYVAHPTPDSRELCNSCPAWGATDDAREEAKLCAEFQFTPPRGGRLLSKIYEGGGAYFNSRPRVGGDESYARTVDMRGHFNSRPRVGGDAGGRSG